MRKQRMERACSFRSMKARLVGCKLTDLGFRMCHCDLTDTSEQTKVSIEVYLPMQLLLLHVLKDIIKSAFACFCAFAQITPTQNAKVRPGFCNFKIVTKIKDCFMQE